MSAPPATLSEYTDAELAEFYSAGADIEPWRAILEAECDRRDAEDAARRAAASRPACTDPLTALTVRSWSICPARDRWWGRLRPR